MPEADGIIKRSGRTNGHADLVVFAKEEAAQKRLVLAGCDPATGLLARMVEKSSGVEIVSAAASDRSWPATWWASSWARVLAICAGAAVRTTICLLKGA